MTLRQIKRQITQSHNKLIQMLYDYVDEHQSNGVVNINTKFKEITRTPSFTFKPIQLHNYDNVTYISYYAYNCGHLIFDEKMYDAKVFTDTTDKFTLGELEFIINLI